MNFMEVNNFLLKRVMASPSSDVAPLPPAFYEAVSSGASLGNTSEGKCTMKSGSVRVSTWSTNFAGIIKEAQPGDLLEIDRIAYQHWAVYVGDGEVIHYSTHTEESTNKAEVRRDDVTAACQWGSVGPSMTRINNGNDSVMKPSSSAEILKRATDSLNKGGYNAIASNCEHFANWCRYHVETSDQVANMQAQIAGNALPFRPLGAVVTGAFQLGHFISKKNQSQ